MRAKHISVVCLLRTRLRMCIIPFNMGICEEFLVFTLPPFRNPVYPTPCHISFRLITNHFFLQGLSDIPVIDVYMCMLCLHSMPRDIPVLESWLQTLLIELLPYSYCKHRTTRPQDSKVMITVTPHYQAMLYIVVHSLVSL